MRGRAMVVRGLLCGIFVLSAGLSLTASSGLDGTEFSGGSLTGPILDLSEIGALLSIVAGVAVLFRPRWGAVVGIVGNLLALPFLLYELAPGPFRAVLPGNYSGPLMSRFVWNATAGTAAVVVVTGIIASVFVFLRRATVGNVDARMPSR